ncbi:MAG: nuclear transport factor 2 family protein [Pseudomonadota bacterium]
MIARSLKLMAGLTALFMMAAMPKAYAEDVAKSLEMLESQTWERWKTKNKTGYAELIAEPAVRITADGVSSGVANTVSLDNVEGCGERHYKMQKVVTHKVTDDVYILTYRAEFGETCDGKAAVYDTYMSSTFRKDGDSWKNVAYTETEPSK